MTTPKQAIKEILDTLDITVETNWTEDGAPALDVIQHLANDDTITRDQVNDANPGFVRLVGEAKPKAKNTTIAPKVAAPDITDREFSDDELRIILDRKVDEAQNALIEAQKRQSEATQEVSRCLVRLDRAYKNHGRQFPPVTAAQNIKSHLEAQIRQARERAGLSPVEAASDRPQIDQTMERNSRRGTGQQRPTRPIMAGRMITAA